MTCLELCCLQTGRTYPVSDPSPARHDHRDKGLASVCPCNLHFSDLPQNRFLPQCSERPSQGLTLSA